MALDQSMTFLDMQLRVCEELGIDVKTGTIAGVTTDAVMLDKIKRALIDGERELWQAIHPDTLKSVQWTFAQPYFSITLTQDGSGADNIANDPVRYRLPRGACSAPVGRVQWRDPVQGGGSGYVRDVSNDIVDRRNAERPTTQGNPLYCSVFTDTTAVVAPGERPPLELRIAPTPNRTLIVTTRVKVQPIRLVNDGDRANRPAAHDMTVIAFAVKRLGSRGGSLPSAPSADTLAKNAQMRLLESIGFDNDMKANSQGVMGATEPDRRWSTTEFVSTSGQVVSFQ